MWTGTFHTHWHQAYPQHLLLQVSLCLYGTWSCSFWPNSSQNPHPPSFCFDIYWYCNFVISGQAAQTLTHQPPSLLSRRATFGATADHSFAEIPSHQACNHPHPQHHFTSNIVFALTFSPPCLKPSNHCTFTLITFLHTFTTDSHRRSARKVCTNSCSCQYAWPIFFPMLSPSLPHAPISLSTAPKYASAIAPTVPVCTSMICHCSDFRVFWAYCC